LSTISNIPAFIRGIIWRIGQFDSHRREFYYLKEFRCVYISISTAKKPVYQSDDPTIGLALFVSQGIAPV